jgi:O-antigen/teichoic acid export membrane protein
LIIPFFLGPASLSFYSLPGNISNRIPGISNSLASILFPLASSYSGTGDIDILRKIYVRSFRLITVLAVAISIVTISFSRELLTHWISLEIAEKATTVLIILAVTNMFLALIGPLSQFLLGLGKLKFLTTLSIIMAVFNTLLLVILVPIFGINGAAWAYLISLIPAIYMFYYTEKYYLTLGDRSRYYISIILKNIIVSSIIWAISFIFLRQFATNLWLVILLGGISGLLYLTLYWLFGFFEKEDVEALKRTLLRIISRFHR